MSTTAHIATAAAPRGHLRRPALHFVVAFVASLLSTALMVLGALCVPGSARADELAEAGAPLRGWTVGAHIATRHLPERAHLHDTNPGLYLVAPEGWVAGGYRNSLGRTSLYAGHVFSAGPAALTVGVISGYRRRATLYEARCADAAYTWCVRWDTGVKAELAPLVAPSLLLPALAGWSARISYLPSFGQLKSDALHLSVEHVL